MHADKSSFTSSMQTLQGLKIQTVLPLSRFEIFLVQTWFIFIQPNWFSTTFRCKHPVLNSSFKSWNFFIPFRRETTQHNRANKHQVFASVDFFLSRYLYLDRIWFIWLFYSAGILLNKSLRHPISEIYKIDLRSRSKNRITKQNVTSRSR